MRAVFSLNPWESKRLIGRAVSKLPEVVYALSHAQLVIAHGSTNVFVAEEVLGYCPERDKYASGQVINGTLCQTESSEKPPILRLVKGKPVPPVPTMDETMAGWDDKCVFIKGANAVDPEFNAAIFNAHPGAGTIGFAFGKICGMGIPLIVPVGLEKLIPSVKLASTQLGHARVDYFNGQKIGMLPLINAKVITEIQAFKILFGLDAVHVGGGGVSGSEGTIVLSVEGDKQSVNESIEEINTIKGEPPLNLKKALCETCIPSTPALRTADGSQVIEQTEKTCIYSGTLETDLPDWFKKREVTY
ncbi:MAG: hypothetical protein MK031_05400 [Alphaproteobacteria bacterium]|nr:hypothetical protein [Alphaproteobacteria bacterium]